MAMLEWGWWMVIPNEQMCEGGERKREGGLQSLAAAHKQQRWQTKYEIRSTSAAGLSLISHLARWKRGLCHGSTHMGGGNGKRKDGQEVSTETAQRGGTYGSC